MFEFLCGKHYLSMSNTICFLWQRSSCFLCIPRFFWWGEHHGWKLASPTLLPENGSLCCYPLKLAQGPGPNNPEVRPRFRDASRDCEGWDLAEWGGPLKTAGGMASVYTVLTCTYTYQVRIELQFISKQLRLECKECAHAGNFILVLDRYTRTLWSLIGLSSGWHRIKRSIWRLASRFDLYQLLWHCFISSATSLCPPWRMPRRLSSPTGINIVRWRTGLDKHDSVKLCNSLIFHTPSQFLYRITRVDPSTKRFFLYRKFFVKFLFQATTSLAYDFVGGTFLASTGSVQGRVTNSVGIHFLWCSEPLVCDFVVAGESVETWRGGFWFCSDHVIVQTANFKLLSFLALLRQDVLRFETMWIEYA